jgi:hypothetical protein
MRISLALAFLVSTFASSLYADTYESPADELATTLGPKLYAEFEKATCALLKSKYEESDIVAVIVDDKKTFCGPTHFKALAKTLKEKPEISTDTYIEPIATLLEGVPNFTDKLVNRNDRHVMQVFSVIVHFYTTPYNKLTLVLNKDGKLETRSVEK